MSTFFQKLQNDHRLSFLIYSVSSRLLTWLPDRLCKTIASIGTRVLYARKTKEFTRVRNILHSLNQSPQSHAPETIVVYYSRLLINLRDSIRMLFSPARMDQIEIRGSAEPSSGRPLAVCSIHAGPFESLWLSLSRMDSLSGRRILVFMADFPSKSFSRWLRLTRQKYGSPGFQGRLDFISPDSSGTPAISTLRNTLRNNDVIAVLADQFPRKPDTYFSSANLRIPLHLRTLRFCRRKGADIQLFHSFREESGKIIISWGPVIPVTTSESDFEMQLKQYFSEALRQNAGDYVWSYPGIRND